MEPIIQLLGDGRIFAYVATTYKVDGAWCAHQYKEYKPRFFKTELGAQKSTSKFIMLNSHLLNVFLRERSEIEDKK